MILTNIKSNNVLSDLKNKKYKSHKLAFMTHQRFVLKNYIINRR